MLFYILTIASHHSEGGGILKGLIEWMLRGFAWRAGSRVASALPIGVIFLIFILGIGYLIYRYFRDRN